MPPEQLFLDNLHLIDDIVGILSFRHRLSADEGEELLAGVRLKLIDDNYAVLRSFAGRSSLKTFLTAVIHRHFLDRRIERWGKWRPAAEARRGGPVAMLLDRLLSRDGLSFDEAVQVLRTNHGVSEPLESLERMRGLMPPRPGRRFVGEEHLADFPDEQPVEDRLIHQLDRDAQGGGVERALSAAMAGCLPDDRLLLKLRFLDGLTVARIARLLAVDQKPLYRRLERIMATLRSEMEGRGIDRAWVAAFLAEVPAKSASTSVPVSRTTWSRAQRGRSPDHV